MIFMCLLQVYSNRAACYTKLGALPEGLKDANKCIELDPAFVKGYSRKGAIQFFMKEYDKALETYQVMLNLTEEFESFVLETLLVISLCWKLFLLNPKTLVSCSCFFYLYPYHFSVVNVRLD